MLWFLVTFKEKQGTANVYAESAEEAKKKMEAKGYEVLSVKQIFQKTITKEIFKGKKSTQ